MELLSLKPGKMRRAIFPVETYDGTEIKAYKQFLDQSHWSISFTNLELTLHIKLYKLNEMKTLSDEEA